MRKCRRNRRDSRNQGNNCRRCCNNNNSVQEVEIIPRAFAKPRCPVICGYPLYTNPVTGELDI